MTKKKLSTKLEIARGLLKGIPLLVEETKVERLGEADDAIDAVIAILNSLIDEIEEELQ